jgi:chromosomal replication initiator protein
VSAELEHIWSRVQVEVARAVDEPTYRLWLERLRPVELSGSRLRLEAPANAARWIRDRFGRVLQASAEAALGDQVTVELTGPGETASRSGVSPLRLAGDAARRALAARTPPPLSPSGPLGNPKLTFDQFVIGDCNRLAHAAALAVAEMPSHAYNPLFLCGPPGVGKTHLMSAIANLLAAHDPTMTVRCTTGEAFTNEFLGALAAGNTEEFKARFRDVDVLLLDDVQFLERKTRTEEEFFHTFNALHDGGRQIVLTCDRPPADLQALEDRLRERFQAGLVADLAPPDESTRLAILRMRAHHDRVRLQGDEALRVIAARVHTNVRALEGALIRVVAFSSLTARPISGELAEEVMGGISPPVHTTPQPGRRTVADIQAAACSRFGISQDELLSPARTARISLARQIAMYLVRELTDESLPAIGRHFGGRDHTTVMHACRRTAARIATDSGTRDAVDALRRQLETRAPLPQPSHDRAN